MNWEPTPAAKDNVVYIQAAACTQNPGILDDYGSEQPTHHHIYVGDNLMADTLARMPQALTSAIEAIFTVMGIPCTH